jgi:hypothetical protein
MALSGIGLLYATAGGIVLWSGIRGQPIASIVRQVSAGQQPSGGNTEQVTAPGSPDVTSASTSAIAGQDPGGAYADPTGASSSTGAAALQQAAKAYGWDSGAQWTALNYVEMREAGYSATARNPSSGALGMAQALGHGNANTAGTLGNEYGGFGLTDAQARLANSGNAYWQAVWMVNYIHSAYGNPVNAAAHEKANNWY